jgi:hypothetical protein
VPDACGAGEKCKDCFCKCDLEKCKADMNGCCGSMGCESGTGPIACGRPGEECDTCFPIDPLYQKCDPTERRCVCDQDACKAKPNGGGCCDKEAKFCQEGNETAACGKGGEQCVNCRKTKGEGWKCHPDRKECCKIKGECPPGCPQTGDCSQCCGGKCNEGKCCVPRLEKCPENCREFRQCPGCCTGYCSSGRVCYE